MTEKVTAEKAESGMAPRQPKVAATCGDEKPKGKWIEVSADYRVLDALVKENKIVDNERQRKRKKRSRPTRYV